MTWTLITIQKVRNLLFSVLIFLIIISAATPDSSLHDIGENGLVVLVRPKHPDVARRVKRRFKDLQKNDEMVSAVFEDFDELDSDEGMTAIYLPPFC